jgi:hypothetical protein
VAVALQPPSGLLLAEAALQLGLEVVHQVRDGLSVGFLVVHGLPFVPPRLAGSACARPGGMKT